MNNKPPRLPFFSLSARKVFKAEMSVINNDLQRALTGPVEDATYPRDLDPNYSPNTFIEKDEIRDLEVKEPKVFDIENMGNISTHEFQTKPEKPVSDDLQVYKIQGFMGAWAMGKIFSNVLNKLRHNNGETK